MAEDKGSFYAQEFIYNWEIEFIENGLISFLIELGAYRLLPYGEFKREGNDPKTPHSYLLGWRGGKKYRNKNRFKTLIIFDDVVVKSGDQIYDETIIYKLDEPRTWRKTIKATAKGFKTTVHAEIELEEESWSDYSINAHWGLVDRTSAKVSASVEAGPASAEASVERETTFTIGGSADAARGNRKKKKTTIREDVEVEAAEGDMFILSSEVSKEKHVTNVTETGYIEASIKLDLIDWAEDKAPYLKGGADIGQNRIQCDTIEELINFIEGRRIVEYPRMRTFLKDMENKRNQSQSARETIKFYKWLKNQQTREIKLKRVDSRVIEEAGLIETIPA